MADSPDGRFRHDSRDPFYRSPGGAVVCGAPVRLRLTAEMSQGADLPDGVALRVWNDGETLLTMPLLGVMGGRAVYETVADMPAHTGPIWYSFLIYDHHRHLYYGNAPDLCGGVGALWPQEPPGFQITVYDAAFAPPAWMRRAVVYQVFPDRFAKGDPSPLPVPAERALYPDWSMKPEIPADFDDPAADPEGKSLDFFGGNLDGIRRKLPYLASLGVTALYLNPIFAARTNHRYDTTDYREIDPMLGTRADFRRLCADARERGIRLLLDGVFSHTGSRSVYFLSAKENPDSPFRGWFQFTRWPEEYACWWGVKTLPNTVEEAPGYLDFMLRAPDAVARHWLKEGASGWRLDVADELPPVFLREMRRAAKESDPQAAVVGEVWENASNKVAYGEMRCYCAGDTLDSVMNYPLRKALLEFLTGAANARDTRRRIEGLYECYPKPFQDALMNLMGSHDRPRILNVLAGRTGDGMPRAEQGGIALKPEERIKAEALEKLFFGFLCAWPGMPTVYYGDEVGMEGANDPFCRGTFPWGKENNALSASFRRRIAQRKANRALTDGAWRLESPHPDCLAVVRSLDDAYAVYAMNRGEKAVSVLLDAALCGGRVLRSADPAESGDLEPADGLYALSLPPVSARLWVAG